MYFNFKSPKTFKFLNTIIAHLVVAKLASMSVIIEMKHVMTLQRNEFENHLF